MISKKKYTKVKLIEKQIDNNFVKNILGVVYFVDCRFCSFKGG
jgi:hypothetical protein